MHQIGAGEKLKADWGERASAPPLPKSPFFLFFPLASQFSFVPLFRTLRTI